MPRGSFDFSINAPQSTEYVETDINEIAARSNGNFQINRSGKVVININDAILLSRLVQYVTGSNGYCLPSTKFPHYNHPSLFCYTDANTAYAAGIMLNTPTFAGNQLGVQGQFIAGTFACTLYMAFQLYKTTATYTTAIKLDLSNGTLSTYNESGAYDTIGTYPVPNGLGMPFVIKYTFDLSTGYYGKLWYGSEAITSLATHKFYTSGGAVYNSDLINVYIKPNTNTNNSIYINDIIITTSEVI